MVKFTNSEKIALLQKELNNKISLRNKRQEHLYFLTREGKDFTGDSPKVEAEIRVIKSEIAALESEINRLVLENRVVYDDEISYHKQFCLYDKEMD